MFIIPIHKETIATTNSNLFDLGSLLIQRKPQIVSNVGLFRIPKGDRNIAFSQIGLSTQYKYQKPKEKLIIAKMREI